MLQGWQTLLQAADSWNDRFAQALTEPSIAQFSVLKGIVARNRQSRFGLAHGFDAIDGIEAFRQRIPIASYEDYAPAIQSMADGATGVLTTAPVVAFEETGGTSAGSKLVPYTNESLAAFRAAVLPWIGDLARRRPGVTRGRAYIAISPVMRSSRATRGGIAIGLQSDAAYLDPDLAASLASILCVDPGVAAISTFDAWRRATLLQLIEAGDLAFISVWSPAFLLRLIESIADDAAFLAPLLSPPARARLEAAMTSSASPAEHLWPHLACISCWTDASSAIYARRLGDLIAHVPIEGKGLLATEAAITIPIGGSPGAVPALLSSFLEFVDTHGQLHLCDDLAVGETYRVIATVEGLYRYDIGDKVICIDRERHVPRLRFVGRAGVVSDLVGEKIDEGFAATVIERLQVVATLVAQRGEPERGIAPHYELRLDHPVAELEALARHAEQFLAENPQYAYARSVGQLGRLLINLRTGHVEERVRRAMAAGRRLGDVKPVSLIPDEIGVSSDNADRADLTQGSALP